MTPKIEGIAKVKTLNPKPVGFIQRILWKEWARLKSPYFEEFYFIRSPYLDNKVPAGHQNIRGRIFFIFLLSSLSYSQIWLNSSCGWLPLWLHHNIERNHRPKTSLGSRPDSFCENWWVSHTVIPRLRTYPPTSSHTSENQVLRTNFSFKIFNIETPKAIKGSAQIQFSVFNF
jgi:hypothetical protein